MASIRRFDELNYYRGGTRFGDPKLVKELNGSAIANVGDRLQTLAIAGSAGFNPSRPSTAGFAQPASYEGAKRCFANSLLRPLIRGGENRGTCKPFLYAICRIPANRTGP